MLSASSSLTEQIDKDLETLFNEFGTTRDSLMPILQEMNYRYNYLNEYTIMRIAEAFDMSATEIYGVASFYHFLRTEPVGKYVISVCQTVSCDMQGKAKIIRVIENELGIKVGQTTSDGKFTLEYTNCIGLCDEAPAMLINDEAYTRLTPEKIVQILKKY